MTELQFADRAGLPDRRRRSALTGLGLTALGWSALTAGGSLQAAVAAAGAAPDGAPQRIVSVGSDLTEIVYALGAGGQVVATDTTSQFPAAAAATRKIGYMRELAAEGVLSLEPDLLLLSAAAGPPSVIRQLAATGIAMARAPEHYTLAAVREKIQLLGQALHRPAQAGELLGSFDRQVSELQTLREQLSGRPRVAFLLSTGRGAPQAAGSATAAQAVLDLINADNVFTHRGYKAVATEAMIALNPEIILMMNHSIASAGGAQTVLQWPAVALTDAGRQQRLIGVDGAALLAFGPRVVASAMALARQIHQLPLSRLAHGKH